MTDNWSVSEWIAALKEGEMRAAQELWARYHNRLLELARARLSRIPTRAADEEDVAQSVFWILFRGVREGRFLDVRNRDDLWWLLLAITRQKSVDYVRRETAKKRGGGRVQSEAALTGATPSRAISLDQLIDHEPTPDLLAMMDEEIRHLLGLLRDEHLRRIAMLRIEGYTVEEIATSLGISSRSVERKLQLIRNQWMRELRRGAGATDTV